MRALVYHEPGRSSGEEVPGPAVMGPVDALGPVDTSTVRGADLHILKRGGPQAQPGTVLGREALGDVVRTASAARTVAPGDRVLVSCSCACGRCRFCRQRAYGRYAGDGGVLGHAFDPEQVEEAYEACSRPDETAALKVAISREPEHTSVLPRS